MPAAEASAVEMPEPVEEDWPRTVRQAEVCEPASH